MKKPTYTPEIKERTVRLVLESEKDYPSTWAAITAIASKIGCTPETLRTGITTMKDHARQTKEGHPLMAA